MTPPMADPTNAPHVVLGIRPVVITDDTPKTIGNTKA